MTIKRFSHISGCIFLCFIIAFTACAKKRFKGPPPPSPYKAPSKSRPASHDFARKELKRMGYTIQAGAFANVDNAARLTDLLRSKGLDATYFAAKTGLYKVRFGNFTTRDAAKAKAISLKNTGVIEEFYIVTPEDYSIAKSEKLGGEQGDYLRDELVKTAESFINVPYLWGGTSSETGFDCSGLTMTVYQLNGLNLPRNSADQYDAGNPIELKDLQKGDLVFFATGSNGRISHVGIYVGDGIFIHSPKKGKSICRDSLTDGYYQRHYVGASTYL